MKKKRGILFGVVFICVLFFVIVFFVRNKESAEPVSKSDFKLNTVVTVTIYDLEEKGYVISKWTGDEFLNKRSKKIYSWGSQQSCKGFWLRRTYTEIHSVRERVSHYGCRW